jgi:hypothetical protein
MLDVIMSGERSVLCYQSVSKNGKRRLEISATLKIQIVHSILKSKSILFSKFSPLSVRPDKHCKVLLEKYPERHILQS